MKPEPIKRKTYRDYLKEKIKKDATYRYYYGQNRLDQLTYKQLRPANTKRVSRKKL